VIGRYRPPRMGTTGADNQRLPPALMGEPSPVRRPVEHGQGTISG
jgi:hypothetical protein